MALLPVKTMETLGRLAKHRLEENATVLSGIQLEMQKEAAQLSQYQDQAKRAMAQAQTPDTLALLPNYLHRMRALAEQSRQKLETLGQACEAAIQAVRSAHIDKIRYQTLLDSAQVQSRKKRLYREQALLDDSQPLRPMLNNRR